MKQSLLWVSAVLFLTSCNSGAGDAGKQHIIDSLVKLVQASDTKTSEHFAATQTYTTLPTANYYIPQSVADTLIENYHKLFIKDKVKQNASIPSVNINRSAFVVPANTLQALLNAPNSCPYVVFYIGFDPGSQNINLFYTGVQPLTPQDTNFTEITMTDPDVLNTPMIFDNGIPCPTCLGIGIHSANRSFSSVVSVLPIVPATSGTITPTASIVQVPYGGNQVFSYGPLSGNKFDSLYVNGVKVTSPKGYESTFTFTNVKQAQTIQVFFSQN